MTGNQIRQGSDVLEVVKSLDGAKGVVATQVTLSHDMFYGIFKRLQMIVSFPTFRMKVTYPGNAMPFYSIEVVYINHGSPQQVLTGHENEQNSFESYSLVGKDKEHALVAWNKPINSTKGVDCFQGILLGHKELVLQCHISMEGMGPALEVAVQFCDILGLEYMNDIENDDRQKCSIARCGCHHILKSSGLSGSHCHGHQNC